MNYQLFNDLADEALKYMNPETDWRFIHADSYTFYSLTPNIAYRSSFPFFSRRYQERMFKELRKHTGLEDAVITTLTLVKCNKYSVVQPLPTDSGIITLESHGAYAAIRSGKELEQNRKSAQRAMWLHSPELMNWKDSDSFGFTVAEQEKPLFPGGRIMNYYPKEGTLFFYYKVDASKKLSEDLLSQYEKVIGEKV